MILKFETSRLQTVEVCDDLCEADRSELLMRAVELLTPERCGKPAALFSPYPHRQ